MSFSEAWNKWVGGSSAATDSARTKNITNAGVSAKYQSDPALQNSHYQVILTQDLKPSPLIVVGMVPDEFQMTQDVGWKSPWGGGVPGNIGDILAVTGNRLVGQVMTMKVWQGSTQDISFTVAFEFRTWSDPEADIINPIRALMQMSMPGITEAGFLTSPGPQLDPEGAKALGTFFAETAKNVLQGAVSGFQGSDPNTQAAPSTASSMVSGDSGAVGAFKGAVNAVSKSGIMRKTEVEKAMKNKISIKIGTWLSLDNILITNVQHTWKPMTPDAVTGVFQSATVVVTFEPMFALTTDDIPSLINIRYNGAAAESGGIAGVINNAIGGVQTEVQAGLAYISDGLGLNVPSSPANDVNPQNRA